jgi:hypothetical protein
VPVPSLNKNQLPLRPATSATSALPVSKSLIKSIGSVAAQPTGGLPPTALPPTLLPLPPFAAGVPPVVDEELPPPPTVVPVLVPAAGDVLVVPAALLAEPP